ncbi:extensin family protein [Kribbella catacumbae]|uniref:extensin family protein n=1 Tax=Kribbella catacumbae TaxID=460086 RepID=UPI000360778C|nr:extensin family protein [Kribbella catacumbae]
MTSEGNLSRRKLLIAGSAGAAGLILPGRALAAEPPEITPLAMVSRNYLGTTGCALYYEPSGNQTSFTFDSTFYNQLVEWKQFIDTNAADSWGSPWRIHSYGAYTNKPGTHGQGRAFDIGKIIYRTSSGSTNTISMRYDVWKNYSNAATYQRRYWGAAASYMRSFRHVLTYKDNSEHHNHIHVDNALYGRPGDATFTTSSSSQTYIVQGACRYVWGHSTGVDGDWGPETQSHSTAVLRRIGRTSGTITNAGNFAAFCTASFRKATGKQAY